MVIRRRAECVPQARGRATERQPVRERFVIAARNNRPRGQARRAERVHGFHRRAQRLRDSIFASRASTAQGSINRGRQRPGTRD